MVHVDVKIISGSPLRCTLRGVKVFDYLRRQCEVSEVCNLWSWMSVVHCLLLDLNDLVCYILGIIKF